MLTAIDGLREVAVTTNGYLLERDAAALVDAGIARFNVSVDSLQRDRFFAQTRRDALPRVLRGLEHLASFPEAHPIKVNAVAIRGFTEHEVLPFARVRPRAPLRGALHRVHALGRRPHWDTTQVLTGEEIRAAIHAVHPLEPAAARAARDRARPPLRRRRRARSASSTRSPSRSAATATASA